jgi:hypothetical protein
MLKFRYFALPALIVIFSATRAIKSFAADALNLLIRFFLLSQLPSLEHFSIGAEDYVWEGSDFGTLNPNE